MCPETLSEEELATFQSMLESITTKYGERQKTGFTLEEYHPEFHQLIRALNTETIEYTEFVNNYPFSIAVNDFKQAILLYQKSNWKSSLNLLKRVDAKFRQEHQDKLHLEASFIMANCLLQLKRYRPTQELFGRVYNLALAQQHSKYEEKSILMQGLCHYKLKEYGKAETVLRKLAINTTRSIDLIQYHSLLGRSLCQNNQIPEGIQELESALQKLEQQISLPNLSRKKQEKYQAQKAQLLYESGYNRYKEIIKTLRTKGLQSLSSSQIQDRLKRVTEILENAVSLWDNLDESQKSFQALHYISGIWAFLGNLEQEEETYLQGMEIAEQNYNYTEKTRFLLQLIPLRRKLNKHLQNIESIENLLIEIREKAFIQGPTIAQLHYLLGQELLLINREMDRDRRKLALGEFLTALDICNRCSSPNVLKSSILQSLIHFYKEEQANPTEDITHKITYYQEQLDQFLLNAPQPIQRLTEHSRNNRDPTFSTPHRVGPKLGPLQDIWVFTASGIEIYEYTPNEDFDPTLFGGFLAALQSFSQEIRKDRMKSFVIGEERFLFYTTDKQSFYMVGRGSVKDSEKYMLEVLQILYNEFNQQFSQFLNPFMGNTSPFHAFDTYLQNFDLTQFY